MSRVNGPIPYTDKARDEFDRIFGKVENCWYSQQGYCSCLGTDIVECTAPDECHRFVTNTEMQKSVNAHIERRGKPTERGFGNE